MGKIEKDAYLAPSYREDWIFGSTDLDLTPEGAGRTVGQSVTEIVEADKTERVARRFKRFGYAAAAVSGAVWVTPHAVEGFGGSMELPWNMNSIVFGAGGVVFGGLAAVFRHIQNNASYQAQQLRGELKSESWSPVDPSFAAGVIHSLDEYKRR